MRYESFPVPQKERHQPQEKEQRVNVKSAELELTYTAKDEKRWAENRERVQSLQSVLLKLKLEYDLREQ